MVKTLCESVFPACHSICDSTKQHETLDTVQSSNTVVIHLARETAVQEPADFLGQEGRERVEWRPSLFLQDHPAVETRFANLGAAAGDEEDVVHDPRITALFLTSKALIASMSVKFSMRMTSSGSMSVHELKLNILADAHMLVRHTFARSDEQACHVLEALSAWHIEPVIVAYVVRHRFVELGPGRESREHRRPPQQRPGRMMTVAAKSYAPVTTTRSTRSTTRRCGQCLSSASNSDVLTPPSLQYVSALMAGQHVRASSAQVAPHTATLKSPARRG